MKINLKSSPIIHRAVKDLVIGPGEQKVKFTLECTNITLKKISVSNGERH